MHLGAQLDRHHEAADKRLQIGLWEQKLCFGSKPKMLLLSPFPLQPDFLDQARLQYRTYCSTSSQTLLKEPSKIVTSSCPTCCKCLIQHLLAATDCKTANTCRTYGCAILPPMHVHLINHCSQVADATCNHAVRLMQPLTSEQIACQSSHGIIHRVLQILRD